MAYALPVAFCTVWIVLCHSFCSVDLQRINASSSSSICEGDVGETCPGHWMSRYGTKWPILCWCATATRSCPPHWLHLQIPPCIIMIPQNCYYWHYPVMVKVVPLKNFGSGSPPKWNGLLPGIYPATQKFHRNSSTTSWVINEVRKIAPIIQQSLKFLLKIPASASWAGSPPESNHVLLVTQNSSSQRSSTTFWNILQTDRRTDKWQWKHNPRKPWRR